MNFSLLKENFNQIRNEIRDIILYNSLAQKEAAEKQQTHFQPEQIAISNTNHATSLQTNCKDGKNIIKTVTNKSNDDITIEKQIQCENKPVEINNIQSTAILQLAKETSEQNKITVSQANFNQAKEIPSIPIIEHNEENKLLKKLPSDKQDLKPTEVTLIGEVEEKKIGLNQNIETDKNPLPNEAHDYKIPSNEVAENTSENDKELAKAFDQMCQIFGGNCAKKDNKYTSLRDLL